MAADIMDKDLKNARNARWSKASTEHPEEDSSADVVNRKGTIVVECLLKASDVESTPDEAVACLSHMERALVLGNVLVLC
jgi:hypothetical protein